MSILDTNKRPIVKFNVNNGEHRKIVKQFMSTRSWSKSPVMFNVEPEYEDVVSMITDRMTRFYMERDAHHSVD